MIKVNAEEFVHSKSNRTKEGSSKTRSSVASYFCIFVAGGIVRDTVVPVMQSAQNLRGVPVYGNKIYKNSEDSA